MRLIVMVLPLLLFILLLSIIGFSLYALISLVQSSRSQAESLRKIESTLKRFLDNKPE